MTEKMEPSCDCGGDVEVQQDEVLGIVDYHCTGCGRTVQIHEQKDGSLKLLLREQYRRVTDP